jgi:hypothetical protein
MEKAHFIKIRRMNGELVLLNINHISMVFADPLDRSIMVTGTGFEKRFRAEEGLALLQMIDSMSVEAHASPASQPGPQ